MPALSVPERSHELTSSHTNLVKLYIASGMVPLYELLCKSMNSIEIEAECALASINLPVKT